MLKKTLIAASFLALTPLANAAEYVIDTKGAHASINFKIQHLGYSWLTGRFDEFDGTFNYDPAKPEQAKITVNINPASVDSNHAERDKHLRGKDFLHVDEYDSAKFVSTEIDDLGDKNLRVKGDLTLHGVTQPITIKAKKIGEGDDPWGGYRVGFMGKTRIALKDFGIDYNLGPASTHVDLELHIEGIKQ